jgi:hypothetical protein
MREENGQRKLARKANGCGKARPRAPEAARLRKDRAARVSRRAGVVCTSDVSRPAGCGGQNTADGATAAAGPTVAVQCGGQGQRAAAPRWETRGAGVEGVTHDWGNGSNTRACTRKGEGRTAIARTALPLLLSAASRLRVCAARLVSALALAAGARPAAAPARAVGVGQDGGLAGRGGGQQRIFQAPRRLGRAFVVAAACGRAARRGGRNSTCLALAGCLRRASELPATQEATHNGGYVRVR